MENYLKIMQAQEKDFESKIAGDFFAEVEKEIEKELIDSTNRKDKFCIAIRDIIINEKAYRNPRLTRDSLTKQMGINKDLFVKIFFERFGMQFRTFINRLRLKESIVLLEQSDLSIEEISDKTGFGTLRTFQRRFRDMYNMSPKDYRKMKQR